MPRHTMARATCPHCGKESSAATIGRHEPVCIHNPANHARYRALLTDHDDIGVSYSEYQARVSEHGAPAVTSLRRMTGARTWDDVLAWFGLRPVVVGGSLRTCPICGKTLKALGYAHHYARCSGGAAGRQLAQEVAGESALIEYEAQVLAEDALQAQCLSVYKPHVANGGGVGFWVR